ncbi:MAG: hypothetical protein WDM76_06700 [Limisphaerales bacterium]
MSDWQLLTTTNPVALPFQFDDPTLLNFQQRLLPGIVRGHENLFKHRLVPDDQPDSDPIG